MNEPNLPLILNLETATDRCSVCLSRGAEIESFMEAEETYQHSKVITILIDACLKKSGCSLQDLDAVAVSSGPGSYTSLRVGAATAKGICFSLNKPLVVVETLRSLAVATRKVVETEDAYYCPMIDARRMEVYCQIFDADGKPLEEAAAKIIGEGSFDEYFSAGKSLVFSGNGAQKCRPIFDGKKARFEDVFCSAKHLVELSLEEFRAGRFVDLAYFTPNYLKAPNITTPKKKSLLE